MINILVVTSDLSLGDLIRQNLEEMGRFRVFFCGDSESAFAFVHQGNCPLTLLDASMAELDLLEIGDRVRHANPRMRFVVIAGTGRPPVLDDLMPEDYLSRPYFIPNLLGIIDNIFPAEETVENDPSVSEDLNGMPWLTDVGRAAQHLTQLTLETSAQAALITREDQLWAYAGQLLQSSTNELTETVLHYWDSQKENDLVRFVRLTTTGAEHMLYATRLTRNMLLALIFDAETPFGTIHSQANKLVHLLSESPIDKQPELDGANDAESMVPIPKNPTDTRSSSPIHETQPVRALRFRRDLSPASSTQPEFEPRFSPGDETAEIDLDKQVETPVGNWKARLRRTLSSQNEVAVNSPAPRIETARKIVLEPVSASVYNLDYACLVLPRFPQHLLVGDLSDRLADWVQETCIAYDWRLEYISARPDYLLWIISVPPSASPAYLMRIMRQRTSGKIFEEFPRYKKENPSGEFWASGYLVLGRSQPPPAQVIKDFIAQTRQRQGILPAAR